MTTEFDHGAAAIRQAIAEHMPSAAVASGWVSEVSAEPWVRWVSRLLPYQDRPTDAAVYGLTRLTAWLETQGITAGDATFWGLLKNDARSDGSRLLSLVS